MHSARWSVPYVKRRALFALLALVTIALGLLVHLGGVRMHAVPRDIIGDVLWATMLAFWIGAAFPAWSLGVRGAVSVVLCWLVELSQLVHTPWLDAVRATRVGHLVLGSGFDPRDLLAYVVGVALAMLLERLMRL